jgi:hypothetical protein
VFSRSAEAPGTRPPHPPFQAPTGATDFFFCLLPIASCLVSAFAFRTFRTFHTLHILSDPHIRINTDALSPNFPLLSPPKSDII